MRLLVIFWSGLGNPRHIATKSPTFVWLWFWFEKVVIGSDPTQGWQPPPQKKRKKIEEERNPNFGQKFVLKAPLKKQLQIANS